MLELSPGLSTAQLDAIAELEARAVRHDGGRLKLEWRTLQSRPADKINDVLWWEEGRLLGFVGIYRFGSMIPELTGMVDPAARGRGIGSAMLDAALPIARSMRSGRALLVVPRVSMAGAALATARGMVFEHSEHALNLAACPTIGEARADLGFRQATRDDLPALSKLFLDGFGSGDIDPARPLNTEQSSTLLVTLDDQVVGTISTSIDEAGAGIHGFVIDPAHQGRGLGGEVLRRICRKLFDEGAGRVSLEVEVQNDRALGLYLRVGFEQAATDDYYSIAL